MGPKTEALALARELLKGTPYLGLLDVEFAYSLQEWGELFVKALDKPKQDSPAPGA